MHMHMRTCAHAHLCRAAPRVAWCGQDNEALLTDPSYRGWRGKRVRGDAYYSLVDEFMQAVFARYPSTLLQFEDFSSDKASNILARYQNRYLCFNDDIQGTGATVLAGVFGALRAVGRPPEAIADLKVAVVGAGSAGIGVAGALHTAMLEAGAPSAAAATSNFVVFDKDGLLGSGRSGLQPEVASFVRDDLTDGLSLDEVVALEKPQLILGLSGRQVSLAWHRRLDQGRPE